jgi:large subunit ribosomal protein L23
VKPEPVKNKGKKSMKELYADESQTKQKAVKAEDDKMKKTEIPPVSKAGIAYRVLLRPVITEKAADQGAWNKYVFEVAMDANKISVSQAVKEVYGIRPVSVNVVSMRGKKVRYGRVRGCRKDWKKAIVTLPEGKTINLYEGV